MRPELSCKQIEFVAWGQGSAIGALEAHEVVA
jgi:hypothetical protein